MVLLAALLSDQFTQLRRVLGLWVVSITCAHACAHHGTNPKNPDFQTLQRPRLSPREIDPCFTDSKTQEAEAKQAVLAQRLRCFCRAVEDVVHLPAATVNQKLTTLRKAHDGETDDELFRALTKYGGRVRKASDALKKNKASRAELARKRQARKRQFVVRIYGGRVESPTRLDIDTEAELTEALQIAEQDSSSQAWNTIAGRKLNLAMWYVDKMVLGDVYDVELVRTNS